MQGVGFWSFWLSSAASIVPWTVTLVYFGSLAKSMADIFNGASVPEGATQYAVFIFSGSPWLALAVVCSALHAAVSTASGMHSTRGPAAVQAAD